MELILSERLTNTLVNRRTIKHEGEYYDLRLELDIRNQRADGYEVYAEINFTGNFFDLRDGEISFHPHPENQIILPNNRWAREGRSVIKIGRMVKMLSSKYLHLYFPNGGSYLYDASNDLHKKIFLHYCEQLSNQVRASICTDVIQISNSPSDIYDIETYRDEDNGSLDSSCMRPESSFSCKEGAWHYNQWKPRIAYILSQQGELRSRALIWDNVKTKSGNTVTLMDRIYGSDTHQEHMKTYAENQGWWHKISQDSCSNAITNGTETDHADFVEVPNWTQSGRRPYMDTFISADDNILWARNVGKWFMQETCAMFEKKLECNRCGYSFVEHDMVEIEGAHYCPDCRVTDARTGNYISLSNAVLYYSRYGNRRYTDGRDTGGLFAGNVNGNIYYFEPI
jgi:hypothetical protein